MRVRAVFRRAEQGTPPAAAREETAEKKGMIPIGDLLLDTESQSLIKNQAVISLTYTEYRILELMAKHRKKSTPWTIFTRVYGGKTLLGTVQLWYT